jgi:hypothetical protein
MIFLYPMYILFLLVANCLLLSSVADAGDVIWHVKAIHPSRGRVRAGQGGTRGRNSHGHQSPDTGWQET